MQKFNRRNPVIPIMAFPHSTIALYHTWGYRYTIIRSVGVFSLDNSPLPYVGISVYHNTVCFRFKKPRQWPWPHAMSISVVKWPTRSRKNGFVLTTSFQSRRKPTSLTPPRRRREWPGRKRALWKPDYICWQGTASAPYHRSMHLDLVGVVSWLRSCHSTRDCQQYITTRHLCRVHLNPTNNVFGSTLVWKYEDVPPCIRAGIYENKSTFSLLGDQPAS